MIDKRHLCPPEVSGLRQPAQHIDTSAGSTAERENVQRRSATQKRALQSQPRSLGQNQVTLLLLADDSLTDSARRRCYAVGRDPDGHGGGQAQSCSGATCADPF